MKVFKLSIIFFTAAFLLTACSKNLNDQVYNNPYQGGVVESGFGYDDDGNRWARENLDLQAVGELLQRSNDAEEFEYLLNNEDGINNLDLNGDGYADYISVREFDDRYDDERGFSLYSMFGPEEIQEICTIIFDRDRYNDGYYPGARVLLTGNEQIYGDNYYYESNWLERSLPIVSWLFTDRNDYYRSPYYYENYPEYYEPYPVVETTVYRTRIENYYPTPVFIQTTQPTVSEVRIVSPYREKSMNKIYSKLAKPTKQQVDFKKNNPGPPEFVQARKENKEQQKNFSVKENKPSREDKQFRDKSNKFERQNTFRPEKQQMREKPQKQDRPNYQPQNQVRVERQQPKFERQNQPRVERQQPRIERQQNQPRIERQQQQQPKFERQVMRPQKQENRVQPNNGGNPNKGGGGNPNKGGGNGNGGGGGGKKGKG